mmetsp:Transcript_19838/g.70183  ORF Transcript_19838/g.70183 Transcript_19838/m.70183 type:complete len:306 (-) Transcript_19838:780-1697(-)
MVSMRCAMVTTVAVANWSRMRRWIAASDSASVALVASSSSRMDVSRSSARHTQSSCRWPTLKLRPPSSQCSSRSRSPRSTRRSTSVSRASSCPANGSRLNRSVPSKSDGSCGTTEMARRSCRSGMEATSRPPTRMTPPASGRMPSSALTTLLLPLPVRPQIATLVPRFSTAKEMPRSTSGSAGRYRICTSSKAMRPAASHSPSGMAAGAPRASSSEGTASMYCTMRSSDVMRVSISPVRKLRPVRFSVRPVPSARASPATDSGRKPAASGRALVVSTMKMVMPPASTAPMALARTISQPTAALER